MSAPLAKTALDHANKLTDAQANVDVAERKLYEARRDFSEALDDLGDAIMDFWRFADRESRGEQ